MLEIITKSKIRQNILKIIFFNQDKDFYLSELADRVGASVGNCQRELEKMVKNGILKSQKIHNLRFYTINKTAPFLGELINIVNKTFGLEPSLKNILDKIDNIEFAFIFGSYVKGEFSATSDVDLFIIGNPDENVLIKEISRLERDTQREINYHLYTKQEFLKKFKTNSFLKNIVKNNILLIGQQNEFKKLLR